MTHLLRIPASSYRHLYRHLHPLGAVYPQRGFCATPPPDTRCPLSKPPVSNWNAANYLSVFRIALAPLAGALILEDCNAYALGVIAVASVTDAVDGYVARRYSLQTELGELLDPLADKSLIAFSGAALAYQGLLPLYVVGVLVSRDLMLVGAATYLPQNRWIPPTLLSKANTGLQFMLCVASVASGGDLTIVSPDIVHGLAIATVSTTALSGVQYIDRFMRATRATNEDKRKIQHKEH